jgi:hypothetical protein
VAESLLSRLRLLRALSLDVVAGAACGGLLAEYAAGARMRPAWWVALLTAVWSIYTTDHLLDAFRGRVPLPTHRHSFHRRHAAWLLVGLTLAIGVGLAAAFALRPAVRAFGFGLGAVVVTYLASAQGLVLRSLPKEPVAGAMYAAGIWGGPLLMGTGPLAWAGLAATLHAIAAILNLAALGVFETGVDLGLESRSLALRWGRARVRNGVVATGLACGALSIALACSAPSPQWSVFAVLAVQAAMPAALLLGAAWFGRHERYRTWGDCVFLLGAVPRVLR